MVSNKRYKIMQQIAFNGGYGGVSKAFNRLMSSEAMKQFDIAILEQYESVRGISFGVIKRYIKEIKKENPDLIHIRGVLPDGLMAIIAARLARVPHVCMSVHGLYSDEVQIGKLKKFISMYIIEPLSFLLVDRVYTVYEGGVSRKKFKLFSKKIWGFIYNPIPEWDYTNEKHSAYKLIREKFGISDNEKLLLCVSRVTFEKGFSYVLDAIKILEKNWPHLLKIMIVGNGDYTEIMKSELKEQVESGRVIFVPATTNIKDYYYGADAFFTASLHENHSNAILEACAARIPIIATDVGGNSESVENNQGGWIIPPFSAEELANAMSIVGDTDKCELAQKGSKAYQYAVDKFDKKKTYEKIAAFYQNMLEEKGAVKNEDI